MTAPLLILALESISSNLPLVLAISHQLRRIQAQSGGVTTEDAFFLFDFWGIDTGESDFCCSPRQSTLIVSPSRTEPLTTVQVLALAKVETGRFRQETNSRAIAKRKRHFIENFGLNPRLLRTALYDNIDGH